MPTEQPKVDAVVLTTQRGVPTAQPQVDVTALRTRLTRLSDRVREAAVRADRDPASVEILLAAKGQPAPTVHAAIEAGWDLIGENRVQEMVARAPSLAGLSHQTHLIGPLQRNKARTAITHADCIQTVSDLRLAHRLDEICSKEDVDRQLDVMIQVNTSGEASKSGTRPSDALDLAREIGKLPRLRLVGWMTVGLNSPDRTAVAASYARLREIRDQVLTSGLPGTDQAQALSMGMSGDLDLAIGEGATMVRIGTAAFGPRP